MTIRPTQGDIGGRIGTGPRTARPAPPAPRTVRRARGVLATAEEEADILAQIRRLERLMAADALDTDTPPGSYINIRL